MGAAHAPVRGLSTHTRYNQKFTNYPEYHRQLPSMKQGHTLVAVCGCPVLTRTDAASHISLARYTYRTAWSHSACIPTHPQQMNALRCDCLAVAAAHLVEVVQLPESI